MEQVVAHDFTGGIAARLASTQFSDRQWSELYGVVLESDAELRTQWPWQQVSDGEQFADMFHADDLLVGITDGGAVRAAPVPDPAGNPLTAWSDVGVSRPDGRLLSLVPLPRDAGQGFVTAVLVNSADMGGTAVAVYDGPSGPASLEFENRFPNSPSDEGSMPRGNVATMWGDLLVLGNIEWLEDEDEPFSASNRARYPNALWFSRPGQPDRWDLLDVVFTGVRDGQGVPTVVGLQPTEQGLMVLTTAGIYLLRGSPSNFDYEEVRPGLSPSRNATVGWWAPSGAAAWVSSTGWVWHSDGVNFLRLDEPLGLPSKVDPDGFCLGWDDYLLAGVGSRVFVFRLLGDGGAWTELHVPGLPVRPFTLGSSMFCLIDGAPWRLSREVEPRGTVDGAPHPVKVSTRTFEGGDGHRLSFWRFFGLRAEPLFEGAALVAVTLFDGPVLSSQSRQLDVQLESGSLAGRDELLVPGPGASLEASVRFTFEGDVSVEQVTAMFTQSRGSR